MTTLDQPLEDDTQQDLDGAAAIARIRELAGKAANCFFITAADAGTDKASRPMNIRQCDGQGRLWFFSASDSHKNAALQRDPRVMLLLQGSEHSDFLQLHGTASVSRDPVKIDELWEPLIRTWFTEGRDDPRITVICVTPTQGYYWDNRHGRMVAGIKMMVGAAIGKTLDDSVEGRLRP